MAPKANGGLRRPAARGRGGVRRPAAAEDEVAPTGARWLLHDLGIAELSRLGSIWLKKCHYYHRQIDVVGKVQGVRVSEGQIFLDLEATGTEDEAFLRAISGKTGRRMTAHTCADGRFPCPWTRVRASGT